MGENQPGFILPVSRQKVKVENLLQILHNVTLAVWLLPSILWHHDSDRTTWQWHCGCTFYLFLSRYMPCLPTSFQLGLRKWESNSLYAWLAIFNEFWFSHLHLFSLRGFVLILKFSSPLNSPVFTPNNRSWIILTILN